MTSATTGHAQVAQLCFGSDEGQLNLKAVQQRVGDLIRVIDTLIIEMQSQGAHWTSFLDKLAVINMTHMQIMADLRPQLRHYIVYPKYVDNPGIENALPELLASRLLPEQVEQEAAWRTAMPGYDYLATQPNVVLDFAETKVAELQDLVAWLTNKDHTLKARGEDPNTEHMQRLRAAAGVLDPKGKARKEIDAMSKEIAQAAADAAAARQKAGGMLPGQQTGVTSVVIGQKRPRPGMAGAQPAAAEPAASNEEDLLIAKIMSGELWPKAR